MILLSTPFGKRGFFHETWLNGGDSWKQILITAENCPRISPEFLEEEHRTLGDWWFEQEYYCEFKEAVDSLFTYDDVQDSLSEEVEPLNI